jgi:lipid A 4'-phosphatase
MKNDAHGRRMILAALAVGIVLAGLVLWPRLDLIVSGWFYRPGEGFFLDDSYAFNALHGVAYAGARLLGFAFLILLVLAAIQRHPVFGLGAKGWTFLFLGLVIGPGLVANGVLKDHWGRARPREVTEFGGHQQFSRALVLSDQCERNCSFVSGDGAFGFYLPSVAYMMPLPRSRRWFWGGMGVGTLFAFARLAAGAHFLSDNVFAAVFMLATLAALHAIMFGAIETRRYWRNWMYVSDKSNG